MAEYTYDAFISYAREDFSAVKDVHHYLRSYYVFGLPWPRKIFTDVTKISAKNPFPQTIRAALEGSRYLVVCCSKHAKHSGWVDAEIEHFGNFHRNNNIILCLVGSPDDDEVEIIPERILSLEQSNSINPIEHTVLMRYEFRGKGRYLWDSKFRREGLGVLFGILGINRDEIVYKLIPHICVIVFPMYLLLISLVCVLGYWILS